MFRSFLFALICAFALVGNSTAAVLTPTELDQHCQKFFRDSGWRTTQDDAVTSFGAEFLDKVGIRATPIVCSSGPGYPELLQSHLFYSGFQTYFFIGVNGEMRIEVSDELRGMIAHEVAHLRSDRGVSCGRELNEFGLERYIACENRADHFADVLAGEGNMALALEWVIQYLKNIHGPNDEGINATISVLHRRIFLLRNKTLNEPVLR